MGIFWKRPIRSSPTWWRRSISSPARTSRAPRCATCARRSTPAALDALIVFGDDQNESYLEDCRPVFAIYYGDTIRNGNAQHTTYSHLPDWYIKNRAGFFEQDAPRDYPVHAALAVHLIETLSEAEFDSRARRSLRAGEGEGHALAYVHRHVLDAGRPVPVVPVFLNTYFPPNQPSPRRCYKLGQAVRKRGRKLCRATRGSACSPPGGLSHFLVDEDFDRAILKALADKDRAFLQTLPRNKLHAGCSEILNWVAIAGAAEGTRPRLVRICAGLSHPGRHRHRDELRDLGVTTDQARGGHTRCPGVRGIRACVEQVSGC